DEVERLIAELRALAPDRAAASRQRMLEQGRRSLRDVLERPRLGPDNVKAFQTMLAALAARDPGAEDELRPRLARRLRTWEPVLDLRSASDAGLVFPEGAVVTADGRLGPKPRPAAADDTPSDLNVPTTVRSGGNVEVTATFDEGWARA